ncbi:acyl carrier protein [Rhodococcus sp. NM-2]|uniref:acyl carrier protein n=1 Tax=unclassified Rhodococcus (in: high G+C Gram-positive bacteria) TaxID=192944 RepID=UPI0024B871BD|nr:acyl carrier protein [Rhodococcus sp. IEGM 1305]MDI9952266.1 acyl carrier protein [Rhodococcus sp. IEGM 1305]
MRIPEQSTPRDHAPVIDWLAGRVAFHTEQPVREVDPHLPLAELGIESVSAVSLCGEIEDRWDLELDPTVVFEYPTIAEMAVFVVGEAAARYRTAS